MNPAAYLLIEGLSTVIIREWLAWQERRQKPVGWVPTTEDIKGFLDDMDWATPENVRELARQELLAAGISPVKE